MSSIEYNGLLLKISRGLSEVDVRDLVFLCRGKIAPGNEETIQDVRSLFTELENHNKLGIDRLEHLKELLKAVEKWSLLKHVKKFEIKRREYNELLQQISQALDESNELERLILICRGQLSVESERNIHDVRTLFTELEIQNNLGIGRLNILKEILKATNSDDLLKKLEQFERRRDEEDEFESRRAQTAALVASARSVGGRVIGVLNMKTIFKVGAAGLTLLTVEEVLSRWTTYDQLIACFTSCVLPAGTQLVQISQGCVCFTIQADNLTALTTLWHMYQDDTLKLRLLDFFVTNEMQQLADGDEKVEVAVTIEEEEYEKACLEFIHEAEGRQPRKTSRRNSDSALTATSKEDELTLVKLKQLENKFKLQQERIEILEKEIEKLSELFLEKRSPKLETKTSTDEDVGRVDWAYLDPFKKTSVEEYLENLPEETHSLTVTSDSGQGMSVAPSEIGSEELTSDEDVGRVDWAYLDPFKKTSVEEYLENLPEETHSLTVTSDSGQGMSVAPSEIGSEELTSVMTPPYTVQVVAAATDLHVHGSTLTVKLGSILTSEAEEKPAFERSRAPAAKPTEQKPQEKPAVQQPEAEKPGPSHTPKRKAKGRKRKQQPGASALGKSPTTSPPANKEKTAPPPSQSPPAAARVDEDIRQVTVKIGSSITTGDHTARQANGNGGLRPTKRPGHGFVGRPIKLRANFFRLNISPKLTDLYHYDVEITPDKCPKAVKRDVVMEVVRKYKESTFQGHEPAFDGEKNLYSRIKLPSPAELSVTLPGEDGGRDREFKVKIQFAASVSLVALKDFLMGKQNGKAAQDAVQGLDIVLRQMPSYRFTPVGRSFFPFDSRRARPLGEGCEVQFGFYQGVRHSEWKAMLVNIDVSAKGFYKSQHVIDFLCETLEVSAHQLEDPRFPIDRRKFEKAIHGIRVETSYVPSLKRKCTVWGLSTISAEKLQFEVEDEITGLAIKTTVVEYFKSRFKLALRYPHLPCLLTGRKKDYYLPLEVCTVVPSERRHLSEQQIERLIRSASRPAPERQNDTQFWAQEVIKTSSKYLREEFQTSVDPEMVPVDGRVLPAPKIKLGPQDQALVPRDGSWDMRNRALYQSAQIETWALACFAPPQRCNEDTLRRFCGQMSTVSAGEGMKMAPQPAVFRYARSSRDVERLFSNWIVELPGLQLIMVVLPPNDKKLYSEIKRVGDNVVGIPTQCVQQKHVQQAKPRVCANISLKINSKLGGINHVIDSSVRPVFTEPTIVFGADVTHPSPTENGIPSIAAVVASMDKHASKYHARVRAQTHSKGGGAQEIINDLAVIVKELLIEFYKANGKLKPSKIIFYRDGVSEGQFDQVLAHEVRAVQEACMMLEKEYRPRITFVVVQKRHHTRLFCENPRDVSGRANNVPPGTTVDSGITHPYEFDFYLCSHFGIQGTSRPAHYHVLYDDNSFTADSLQQLTYQLCHVYARCTRSVSIPAPAYYAHLAAFRARCHVTDEDVVSRTEAMDFLKCARDIQVNEKMKGVMYFV